MIVEVLFWILGILVWYLVGVASSTGILLFTEKLIECRDVTFILFISIFGLINTLILLVFVLGSFIKRIKLKIPSFEELCKRKHPDGVIYRLGEK